jgi:hypothetical protein
LLQPHVSIPHALSEDNISLSGNTAIDIDTPECISQAIDFPEVLELEPVDLSAHLSLLEGGTVNADPDLSETRCFPTKRKSDEDSYDNSSHSSGNESDSNENRQHRTQMRRKNHDGAKPGSSWARAKALKDKASSSDFVPNTTRYQNFCKKVLSEGKHCDSNAEFDPSDVQRVRCSTCSAWVRMRVPYDIKRWHEHRATKKCIQGRSKKQITKTLTSYFVAAAAHSRLPAVEVPCPGLTATSNKLVNRYLHHTTVSGGGAPARYLIAKKRFPSVQGGKKIWANLSNAQRRVVLRIEQQHFAWRIDRTNHAVYSMKCEMNVYQRTDHNDGDPLACGSCRGLMSLHTFQVALSRAMPSEENMKYIPRVLRGELELLYLRINGLRQIVEAVRVIPPIWSIMFILSTG